MPALAALWLLAAAPDATLVIYRDTAEPLLFRPMLVIDGHEVGALGENRYIAVALPAGAHRVEARWPRLAGHKPVAVMVTVSVGQEAYLELTGTAAFWRTPGRSALVRQPAAEGAVRAAACCTPAR